MAKTKKGKMIKEVVLRVLGFREDDKWIALALEMDLRGYGDSFHEAFDDLMDLVRMQISFAHFKSRPELILRPADPIWFERYAEVRREKLHTMLSEEVEDSAFQIAGMPIPPPHVIAALEFNPTDA